MPSVLLPWTTRGLSFGSREYLASVSFGLEDRMSGVPPSGGVTPDTPFTEAIPILRRTRVSGNGLPVEYGCFDNDGTIIGDPSLNFRRQSRNILYYMIRDLFNLSRGASEGTMHLPGADIDSDPVPESPKGEWAVLRTESCPHRDEVDSAVRPLLDWRGGTTFAMPRGNPQEFREWLLRVFNRRALPRYLLICDTFANVPPEYQFLLNAFAATGRLWFDDPLDFAAYANKIVAAERGKSLAVPNRILASPVDDTVTFADYQNLVSPLLEISPKEDWGLTGLVRDRFDEASLLAAAQSSEFLGLYCHGLGLDTKDWETHPDLQGSFVLRFESKEDEALLTPDEVRDEPFAPGGIVFSPACLSAGTHHESDFAAWIDPEGLSAFLGPSTQESAIGRSMLASPTGPAAALLHFDISIASSAPMYNPLTQRDDLQRELHTRFLRSLFAGATLGKATQAFRWATGAYYTQAIYIFGQLTGTYPYIGIAGGRRKTVGEFVNSMNQYHVTATDMRNYMILGDPASRLPGSRDG